jgi:ribose 5-phosphate isomerase B
LVDKLVCKSIQSQLEKTIVKYTFAKNIIMIVAIASDHAGFELKEKLKAHFSQISFHDFGTHSTDSMDYPDVAHPLATFVETEKCLGVLICGSGNGVNITANKHQGVRSALCWTAEIASLAKQHNDANVIAIPARFVSAELAIAMVDAFLNTPFEGGRHQTRVNKIFAS